jgi:prepilin-type N-terminal cleavage/methylation domain-containing protein
MTRRAFTLIEILVVTAVFSLVVLIATGAYTTINSRQRSILARQRVVADGRYVLEAIARTVRIGSIDYAYYGNGHEISDTSGHIVLATRDQQNNQTCYQFASPNLQVSSDCSSGSPTWATFNPSDIQVNDLRIYISPRSNPAMATPQASDGSDCKAPGTWDSSAGVCQCNNPDNSQCWADQQCVSVNAVGTSCTGVESPSCICQNARQQPQVTIVISTTSNAGAAAGEQASISLQTTVASRTYHR